MKKLLHAQTISGTIRDLKISEPIVFSDNEKKKRSGHMSHAMACFDEGKIIDFYSNCSNLRCYGHEAYGWVEYKISEDYGKTFGRAKKFKFSWDTLLAGEHTVSVEKVVSPQKNILVAFCLMNSQFTALSCEPWDKPQIAISKDGGKTWTDPYVLCEHQGRIYDATYYNGSIFALEFCNPAADTFLGSKPEHVYRLYRSDDNGESFYEVCVVPFPDTKNRGYGNMIFTPEGKLIVYTYNYADEVNMDCAISSDLGKTWDEIGKSYVAKKIRNPQVGLLDGQFILHGRSGGWEDAGFVFYTSADGVHWDEGQELIKGKTACFYSNNLTITGSDGKERMLVQYSENISGNEKVEEGCWPSQVNAMHLWIESVENEEK